MAEKGKGNGIAFLRAHLGHQGDGCVIWPMSVVRGYGMLGYNGGKFKAHRLMCTMVHGEPPEGYEAAHECGNSACVNPKHLTWKTHADNQQDIIRHGRNKLHGCRWTPRLTPAQAAEIRRLKDVKSQDVLAAEFGVRRETIRAIHQGRIWKNAA